jgi:hypothetical protein
MLVGAAMFAVSELVQLRDHGACREMGRWNVPQAEEWQTRDVKHEGSAEGRDHPVPVRENCRH